MGLGSRSECIALHCICRVDYVYIYSVQGTPYRNRKQGQVYSLFRARTKGASRAEATYYNYTLRTEVRSTA